MRDVAGNLPGFSPRSGRQHKAWGVSPRTKNQNVIEPAKRATAGGIWQFQLIPLSPAPRAPLTFPNSILGLTPQALC
jgi:hypothetical protein